MASVWVGRVVVAMLAVALLGASVAHADGDPASDVLLGENVFYPYSPAVSVTIQRQLNAETASAKRAGFPIKVALIAAPVDLGVIPDLFGKPQQYADFLDQEISFRGKQPLLVVMATGYGVQGLGSQATAAVAALSKPAGHSSDELAQAALSAVAQLAKAGGHALRAGSGSSGSGSGGSSTLITILLAAAAITAAALAAVTLRRRRGAAA